MKIKTIAGVAQVAYLNNLEQAKELVGNWIKFDKLIYILQPSKDTRIPTEFAQSRHFDIIQKEIHKQFELIKKTHPNYDTKVCTGCLFESENGSIISVTTQNLALHDFAKSTDKVCIRETLRNQGAWQPGDSYEVCKGCSWKNHPESRTLLEVWGNSELLKKYQGSTCYISNHWWCCDICRQNMFKMGVSKIIINPLCERVFGENNQLLEE